MKQFAGKTHLCNFCSWVHDWCDIPDTLAITQTLHKEFPNNFLCVILCAIARLIPRIHFLCVCVNMVFVFNGILGDRFCQSCEQHSETILPFILVRGKHIGQARYLDPPDEQGENSPKLAEK